MTGAGLDAGSESYSLSDSRTFRLVRPTHCCLVKLSDPVARDPRSGQEWAYKEQEQSSHQVGSERCISDGVAERSGKGKWIRPEWDGDVPKLCRVSSVKSKGRHVPLFSWDFCLWNRKRKLERNPNCTPNCLIESSVSDRLQVLSHWPTGLPGLCLLPRWRKKTCYEERLATINTWAAAATKTRSQRDPFTALGSESWFDLMCVNCVATYFFSCFINR